MATDKKAGSKKASAAKPAKAAKADPTLADVVSALTTLTDEVRRIAALLESGAAVAPAAVAPVAAAVTAASGTPVAAPAVSAPESEDPVVGILRQVFAAALEEDFDAFVKLVHSERIPTTRSIGLLKSSWWLIIDRLPTYLKTPGDPTSFEVARREPPELDAEAVKAFIWSSERTPPPVSFRRDPEARGQLRITDYSI